MRLVSILIFKWHLEKPVLLSSHSDVSFVNFFMRSTIREHILFHSRLVVSRTTVNARQTVTFEQNLGNCHCYVHPCGLAAAVLADAEYPQRVAFSLINKALLAFNEKHFPAWQNTTQDCQLPFPEGDAMLTQYQDPMQVDGLMKVQKDLDEVKEIMLKNMEEILQRGEKLDDLISKTDDLSKTSRDFYRSARSQNQCCQLY